MFGQLALLTVPIGIAAILGALVPFAVWAAVSNPVLVASTLFVLAVIETLAVSLPALQFGILVYPQDLVLAIVAAAGVMRLFTVTFRAGVPWAWLVTYALVVLSALIGLLTVGKHAGVDFRQSFYFFAATSYFISVPVSPQSIRKLCNYAIRAGLAILAIVFMRWISDALGLNNFQDYSYIGAGVRFRVIQSTQALILVYAICACLYLTAIGLQGARPYLVLLLLAVVIVLQHRSVWVVSLGSLAMYFVLEREKRDLLFSQLTRATIVLLVVGVPILAVIKADAIFQQVGTAFEQATSTREGTFVARIGSWQALLAEWVDYASWEKLIGRPFGGGYERYVDGALVEFQPHNYYVQVLLRAGILGIAAFVTCYAAACKRLYLIREAVPSAEANLLLVMLGGQLLFFIPYGPHYLQGIWLGLGIALACGVESRRRYSPKRTVASRT